MNPKSRIKLGSTTLDAALAMSEGNPGAISVLGKLLKTKLGLVDMLHLDDAQIYGSDIWIGYKDVCKEDINKFITLCRNRKLKSAIEKRKS